MEQTHLEEYRALLNLVTFKLLLVVLSEKFG
jgi:hypothetical protein